MSVTSPFGLAADRELHGPRQSILWLRSQF